MKRIVIVGVVLALVLVFLYGSSAGNPRIVFADVNRVVQEYPKWIELNQKYAQDAQFYQQKLNELLAELDKLQKAGAPQSEIEKKQAEIASRKQQYEQLLQSEYQPKMQTVLNELAEKIEAFAKAMGYDFVLKKEALLYADDAYDVTEQLVNYLKNQ
ncbi:molecular chaperone Skp [Pseudothermotoga hypogea DSM 11164 = NBRC 106472]|uniref:Molecular chaperone Skp n=1 Tax=Pseudothermotoga hypogea DSM 11164 = NBRC 106472 TaxID=1123384 RepID=A0A0X1KSG9_9THEM|nr:MULTISPECIES: OmpH family outer membrane protein [Pseudothermotoga]AJC74203.1 molecular chaperone Skp [Pseudothermotoga hypogea DSM 11164 = NBRC 106472]MBC7123291.1 OmpH family outer membrane protein [Pseudothermotoga sp.]MDI6862096.1 OmpH family outer membrane protein [Pseudothermotoga sp.]